ncbi:GNAT family N-acetyltransferase [Nocardioides aequoreus]|uniref:GNAT family N-acetyltransferase n=1 Tax=Nocardioides aequoreus TaxID=397278 RepID=UPI0004C2BF91|nr:GNAT family N-acetyltransferase [Nocardioides aequoreus]
MRVVLGRDEVGEGSWAGVADRRAGPGARASGPVLAVDLSGDPLVFGTDPDHRLACRPLTPGDLEALARWVRHDHVARWWVERPTPRERVRSWIWEVNGRSVGYAQDYPLGSGVIGFDYLLGEPAYVGRGLGTSLLWVYLRDVVVPAYDGVRELVAAPDHRNAASRRVLRKVGATEGLWTDEPGSARTLVAHHLDVARVLA